MHLISATSSQLLYAVVNSAYLSERDYDEMHQLEPRNGGRLVDLSETSRRCSKRNPLLPFRRARLVRRSLGLSSVSASARS